VKILLKSSVSRWVLVTAESAVLLALVSEVTKTYLAEAIAQRPTVGNFQLAAKLDPDNSDYPLRLGLLSQYGLTNYNPDRAVDYLKRAIELSPYDPEPWLELGGVREFQGNISEAEACLRRADFLTPNLPAYQYAIGNVLLLHGNVEEAFRHFSRVLAGSTQYNQILFDTAWKASGDAGKILANLIPIDLPTEISYLNYLVTRSRLDEAKGVWQRILGSQEIFDPHQATAYLDALIQTRRAGDAYQVWEDLRAKGLINPTHQEDSQNLVMNGDFEEEILNIGFGWRVVPAEGVSVGLDRAHFHSPGQSLLVQFSRKQNLDYRNVFQYVRVLPGRAYRLRGLLMTEGITTDSGVRLEVRDAYSPGTLDKFSEGLSGSTSGWVEMEVDFTAGPKTDLVVAGLARLPSTKLDNLIEGKVWMDDLHLTESSATESSSPKN
jgi:tetratricopeptide (TPR) repeat protein